MPCPLFLKIFHLIFLFLDFGFVYPVVLSFLFWRQCTGNSRHVYPGQRGPTIKSRKWPHDCCRKGRKAKTEHITPAGRGQNTDAKSGLGGVANNRLLGRCRTGVPKTGKQRVATSEVCALPGAVGSSPETSFPVLQTRDTKQPLSALEGQGVD